MGFTIPILEKACICLELATGTIILGVINLIICVIGAGAALFVLVGFGVLHSSLDDGSKQDGAVQAAGIFTYVVMTILLILCIFYIIISSLLIHGARTGRPGLLMPWIVLTCISMVLNVLNVIGSFINGDFSGAGSTIAALVLQGYFFLIVYSLRKQL